MLIVMLVNERECVGRASPSPPGRQLAIPEYLNTEHPIPNTRHRVLKEISQLPVKIRLRRMGAKKKPFYRLVVANSTSPRDGRFIDTLGHYDPCTEPPTVQDRKSTR